MTKDLLILKDKFFAGIVRDEKSKTPGALSNCEELDIFTNGDFIQPEQVMSADALPATSEAYAYCAGDDDTMYAYGQRTDTTAGTIRLFSVASGGASDPSTFSTLFTSADTTNLASITSDLKFFRTTEASNATSLYYIGGASTTWYLRRYNIGAGAEQIWDGSTWTAGSSNANSDLTGLNGSFMRPTMKVIFGDLYICHGRYIAKVDADKAFTEKAFTLPSEWEAVDIISVGDKGLILCRNKNRLVNQSKCFWWDLSSTTQFDDSFGLPMGGPLWVVNHKETVKMACSQNGTFRIYQLSGPFQGALPIELPGIILSNMQAEATTQPISSPKMVSSKDNVLYFALYKSDKTGIYGLSQLDADKPNALILSKRFIPSGTTDYASHKPTALLIQGPNYYAAYYSGAANVNSRCESNNSPSRSSDAFLDTTWIDGGDGTKDKNLNEVILNCKPLSASTSLSVKILTDFDESTLTTLTRADATSLNTTSAVLGHFVAGINNKKAFKVRVLFTSATTASPKLQSIYLKVLTKEETAKK